MLTEYDIVNAAEYTVPSTRVFAWYLGIDYRERPVAEITASVFTQSPQEFVVKHLAEEVHRAYSGNTEHLTVANLIAKVRRLVPAYYFQLDRELEPCAMNCLSVYGDDLSPVAALLAVERCRSMNNKFQSAFTVTLTIEVLARLVKNYDKMRYKLLPLSRTILFNNYIRAAEDIQICLHEEKTYWAKEEAAYAV